MIRLCNDEITEKIMNSYQLLAKRLDSLPNGFPATKDGAELRLLEKLFTPEEAELAAMLKITLETPDEVGARLGEDPKELRLKLKSMAKRGMIKVGRTEDGLGYGLLPFVVGIYEFSLWRMDSELAELFEDYYQKSFAKVLEVDPQVHRVVPVNETIRTGMEIAPYESVSQIVDRAKSWGILDCICRVQKKLIGDPCEHPVDVCMTMSPRLNAYDQNPIIKALTQEEAMETLQRAADAGLVHSVSNSQEGGWYICNCCTCSCGILRGMAEMGLANVVARSSYINVVEPDLCNGCETCVDFCQFNALEMGDDFIMTVSDLRCVGCGVCVPVCDTEALSLVLRDQPMVPPVTEDDWLEARAEARGQNLEDLR
jgi:Pyruvate/2-oxoacid:ferredoxin oxidoreductase delta subunit